MIVILALKVAWNVLISKNVPYVMLVRIFRLINLEDNVNVLTVTKDNPNSMLVKNAIFIEVSVLPPVLKILFLVTIR
jgi:hypothetical protein